MAKEEYKGRLKLQTFFKGLTLSLLFVIFLSLGSSVVYGKTSYQIDNKKTVPISGSGAVVMDAKNGNILYSLNGDKRFYPASCTKILAAVIALEEGDLKQKVTVSENAVYNIDYDSSHIALDAGEKITMKDALYGMLLTSGNDCSVVVAETISGSVDEYADKMNKKAKEIGCTDSHFTNPHGLYHKNHYTTPEDLARIMRYCVGNKDFMNVASALRYNVPKTNKSDVRELWNNHRMLKNKYMYYAPIVCGKSGYITKSGFNLVSYGKKDGMELIVVIMKEDDPTTICKDTQALMEHYFNNYESTSLPSSQVNIESVKIKKKEVPVTVDKNFHVLLPKGVSTKDITFHTQVLSTKLPIKKGAQVGIVQAVYNNKVLGTTPLYAEKTISGSSIKKVVLIVLSVVGILLLVFLILVSISKVRRSGRRRIYGRQKRKFRNGYSGRSRRSGRWR